MSETQEALVGQVIASQFRVIKKLGAGGMGAVFLAEQLEMERKVVVKVLHPELSAMDPVAIERFRREAKAVAQLNHPNIVQVFVFGHTDNGQMYLAMEYIEGRDLAHELAAGPMPEPRALRILDQCCAALIEAHGAGIVHRDLKPENIMLADRYGNPDYVKVLDFGIAKLHSSGGNNPTLTQAGSVFGTPRYMSPEQVKGLVVDARSDLYALGIILYEMLVGRHPFVAETTIEYLMKHVSEAVRAPSSEGIEIQPRVEALLMKCLEKAPADRYQSAAELQREVRLALRDFSEATRGFPSSSLPLQAVPRAAPGTQPPGRKHYDSSGASSPAKHGTPSWLWVLMGLVLAAGLIGVVIALAPPSTGEGAASRTGETAASWMGASAGEETPVVTAPGGEPSWLVREAPVALVPASDPSPVLEDVPTTAIEAGEPLEGFPLPKDARHMTSASQAEMYETALEPRAVIAFYKATLHGKYSVKDVPNGVMIEDEQSPFSYVVLSPNGDRYYLILQRNLLAPKPAAPAGPPAPVFGVDFPADASLIMRSEQATVMRSRLGMKQVCDFYEAKYGALKGVMVMRDDAAATPYCTIAATMSEETAWMAIAIVNDSTSAGAVMISVMPRAATP